jgi:hypothetical protein
VSLSAERIDEGDLPPVVLRDTPGPVRRRLTAWFLLVAGAVVAGVVLRAYATSELWRDEALSVNIARLPLEDLVDALRRDGHPPAYYVLLNAWIDWFGDGNAAVRSLSTVCSVAALPLAWIAGRRLGGWRCGIAALVLLATSPFAIRYGSEGRMYALVVLLVFAGWLLVRTALDRPAPLALGGIVAVSGALLLTHYWAAYLVAATVLVLLATAWRSADRRPLLLVAGAVAAGGLLFLPWASALLGQVGETGTPWGLPSRPGAVVASTVQGFGGEFGEAVVLGVALVVLVLLGLFARSSGRNSVELDLRTRPGVRGEVAVLGLALALAAVGSYLTEAAFAARYASVVFPLFVLAAAYGLTRLPAPGVRAVLLGSLALLGLAGGLHGATASRTQAGQLARAISTGAGPGDLVVYCPDQLGPAVSRLVDADVDAMTFPDGAGPARVDWVDYLERAEAVDLVAFAREAATRAGSGALWLVWSEDYRGLEGRCTGLDEELATIRGAPDIVVIPNGDWEHGWVHRFPAPAAPAG